MRIRRLSNIPRPPPGSSFGNNLTPSNFVGENILCIVIAVVGLVLFALLVGNIQTFLQSLSARLEEMRLQGRDTELWMKARQLPAELRRKVRKHDRYTWEATSGVDEQGILEQLPEDLRRDIKRHLCIDLVRKVRRGSRVQGTELRGRFGKNEGCTSAAFWSAASCGAALFQVG